MRALRALTRAELLLFARNPTSVFMALLLPSLLLLLQGAVIPGSREPFAHDPAARPIDYLLPIALTVAVTSVAVTNYPSAIGAYRESGVLRRLGTTPVSAHNVLFSQWTVSGLSLVASVLIATTLGVLAFDVSLPQNAALAVAALVTGTVAMMAVGSIIAATAGSAQIAYGAGLLIFIASLFTAGVWTPGPMMPEYIAAVAALTPAGAMTGAVTDAWHTGTVSPADFAVMGVWALAAGALALKLFKWR